MLPIVHLTGSAREQGRAHGEALRERVAWNRDVYFERFWRETRLRPEEVLERAALYGEVIARLAPEYDEAMRGVAEGSGLPFGEVVALNVRYEILYYQFGAIAMAEAAAGGPLTMQEPDGCTAFAVLPERSANGHLLLGQNWDWIPQVRGAVLHTVEPDGLETLAFNEAGIVGAKTGFNSAGLGLTINGMTTTDDDWSRLRTPVHVRCHRILRSRNLEAAARVVTGEDRACSTNFLLAQAPDRALDLEAAPLCVRRLEGEDGTLVHTNHFLDPGGLGIIEPPSEKRPHSCHRRERMAELLAGREKISEENLKSALRDHEDHPFGICRHEDWSEPPEEHYITVASAIMDLEARTMLISDGPPCSNPYQRIPLA